METQEYIRNLEGELQFTRENLQATIEELHTVNAEYQDRIIELTELHNDVDNLLAHSQIGKLLLDENMEIRRFSPQISRIFHIMETDEGRPLADLSHRLLDVDPIEAVHHVLATVETVEKEVRTDDGRWLLMRVVPYQVGPEVFSGAVMTFIDISQVKTAQKALAESEADLRKTARMARVGSWEYDPATGRHRWSEETFRIHELEPGEQPRPEEGIRFYAPEWRPVIAQAFRDVCEKGTPYDLILEIVTARGNRRWVRAIGQAEMTDGRVTLVSGAFQDITERKRAEAAPTGGRRARG